jgi:hypothetical protein
MRGLIVGKGVVEWVADRLGVDAFPPDTTGLGWWDYHRILMGAVYNNYNGAQVHMHLARLPGVRLSPGFVRYMLDYPFRQLKVKRITGTIAASNAASIEFAEHLGARFEGRMKDALPNDDLLIYGLPRTSAEKWLTEREVPNGLSCRGRTRQESVAAA